MKIKSVKYERLYNTGNYEHVKIGVEVCVGDCEAAQEVYDYAKRFVEERDPAIIDRQQKAIEDAKRVEEAKKEEKEKLANAEYILSNRDKYDVCQVANAAVYIKKVYDDNLPF